MATVASHYLCQATVVVVIIIVAAVVAAAATILVADDRGRLCCQSSRQGPPLPLLSVAVAADTAVDIRHHCHCRHVATDVFSRTPRPLLYPFLLGLTGLLLFSSDL